MDRHEMISKIRPNETAIQKILVSLVLLLCLGVAVKAIGVLFQRHWIARTVSESMEFLKAQNEKAGDYLASYAKETEKLKEKGAFCSEKKEPPPPQVTGILGDSVLIDNKWCKVGDEQAGAKVLKIEPTQVTVLWKEKEVKLAPLLASNPGGSNDKPKMKPQKKESATEEDSVEVAADRLVVQQSEDDPLAWLGMEVSAELRSFLLKLFETMPAEQVEQAKQEWAGMSEDQKKQRLDEAQQMVDSGQADAILEQM